MEVPYYEPTGNGDNIRDFVQLTPDGHLVFKHSYSSRMIRQRHGAQAGETLDLGLMTISLAGIQEGDL